MARLPRETDLTVAQIAEALRFEEVRHVARYLARAKRLSPLAYLQRYRGPVLSSGPAMGEPCASPGAVEQDGAARDRARPGAGPAAGLARIEKPSLFL